MKTITERQYPLASLVNLGIANMGAGNEVKVKLPPNALFFGMTYFTATAFDSATTATGTVFDGTTTFVAAVDVKTVGAETVTNVPKFYPTGGELTFSLAQTGAAATVGQVLAVPQYVVVGRGNEVITN